MRQTRSRTLTMLATGLLLSLSVLLPALAREVPTQPSVTVLRDRTVPAPYVVSAEMQEIVAARRVPEEVPVPTSKEQWLKLQEAFDAPGEELERKAAKHNGVTYEVRDIAGVRCYVLTPKEIHRRFAGRVFVHADLHIYDGQAHGDYIQSILRPVPESADAQRELFAFFDKHLK